MLKFLAIVRHEYRKIVLRWSFLIATLLLPTLAAAMAFIPALIFSLDSEPLRLVIVDSQGSLKSRIAGTLSRGPALREESVPEGMFGEDLSRDQQNRMRRSAPVSAQRIEVVDVPSDESSQAERLATLREMVLEKKLDGYLVIPADPSAEDARFEYFSRKAGDFVINKILEDAVRDAVRAQKLADANIDAATLEAVNRRPGFEVLKVDASGDSRSEGVFAVSFAIGLMIYITLAIYGQQVLGAVVEEKETRIAEILFSSASPFHLMLGKLVGVGLAALTQLAVWLTAAAAFIGYGIAASGVEIPSISPLMVFYFLLFFVLGFFLYASIFALIGSMVTTVQEGSQFSIPPIMLLLVGFYFVTAVIRDPGSQLSFWVSLAPFFSPITMPVRILAEAPPMWQILLSVVINLATITFLIWLAGRVYRVGLMMYGKRATIPEVLRWIRQS
jgi:ABC-2 type transport system permease protein